MTSKRHFGGEKNSLVRTSRFKEHYYFRVTSKFSNKWIEKINNDDVNQDHIRSLYLRPYDFIVQIPQTRIFNLWYPYCTLNSNKMFYENILFTSKTFKIYFSCQVKWLIICFLFIVLYNANWRRSSLCCEPGLLPGKCLGAQLILLLRSGCYNIH